VIGVGFMGRKVVECLLEAGHDVTVHDRSEQALAQVPAAAVRAGDLTAALTGQDAVLLLLRTGEQVVEVVRTLVAQLGGRPDAPVVVSSATVSTATTAAAAAACRAAGIGYVDAPVNGRPPHLTIFAGAGEADLERARPLLEQLGSHLHHLGPCGSGTAAKLVHQGVLYGTHLLVQEALALAGPAGLDRAGLLDALRTSSARGAVLDRVATGFSAEDLVAAPVDLVGKDLDLLGSLAAGAGVDAAMFRTLGSTYEAARRAGAGHEHFSRVLDHPAPDAGEEPGRGGTEVVREFIGLMNAGRLDRLGEVLADDFVWRGIDGGVREGVEGYLSGLGSSSYRITIERLVAEDDLVVARLRIRRADGTERVTHDMFRVAGGRIREEWSGHA
jgi:3-hydroxyisobutyrate dehydrogenase-like beta-hydroxyacid dehydrogenase/predicted SnoaL-like aldol condensation-catalyzing enzyme